MVQYFEPTSRGDAYKLNDIKFEVFSEDFVKKVEDPKVFAVGRSRVWFNKKLTWDPSDYDNITEINVNPKLVWSPDIYMYEYRGSDKIRNGFLNVANTLITLQHDGRHKWLAPLHTEINCPLNVTDYPFDEQQCDIRLGSLTLDSTKLIIHAESPTLDLSIFRTHSQWYITDNSMQDIQREAEIIDYDVDKTMFFIKKKYSEVLIRITLKRKSRYLVETLIMPKIVVAILSILIYLMPVATGERIIMLIHLFLVLAFFLVSSIDIIPYSPGELAFLSYIVLGITIIMILNIINMIYSFSIYYANSKVLEIPHCLRFYILDQLAQSMGVNVTERKQKWLKMLLNIETSKERFNSKTNQINANLKPIHPGRLWGLSKIVRICSSSINFEHNQSLNNLTWIELSKRLSIILEELKEEERIRELQRGWNTISSTLDTIFLYMTSSMLATVIFWCIYKAYF